MVRQMRVNLKITYWLPRLLILGFAASMVIPAPRFVTAMDDAEFLVWLLRLIWVLVFPLKWILRLLPISSALRAWTVQR